MMNYQSNIRANLAGDQPEVHSTALIDPSAQIIGNVKIGKNVFIAPLVVIRSDERGSDGSVRPIIIEEDVNIQDGVIIHSHGGESVIIGARTSVAHGVAIHGPCNIGADCFLAMRASLYSTTLEDSVWVGMGAIVMRATIEDHIMVPPGSVIRGGPDLLGLRFVSENEKKYMADVREASAILRNDYLELRGKAESLIRDNSK